MNVEPKVKTKFIALRLSEKEYRKFIKAAKKLSQGNISKFFRDAAKNFIEAT